MKQHVLVVLFCVEQSLDPQTESEVQAVAVKIIIVQK